VIGAAASIMVLKSGNDASLPSLMSRNLMNPRA
jgi:hypothetical protein